MDDSSVSSSALWIAGGDRRLGRKTPSWKKVKMTCSLYLTEPGKNPGEFNTKLYYRSKGVLCTGYIKALKESRGADRPFMRLILKMRGYCGRVLEKYCEKEDIGIYKAILLGDTSFIETDILDMYRASGIAHLLAVSGQHLSLIGGGMYLLFRKTIGGFRTAGILSGSFVISYGIFTGSSGSTFRAVFMICCLWLAAERGRTYDSLSALGFAALSLLGKNPYLIFHSGFQLSFAAVLAISGPGQWMIREYKIEKTGKNSGDQFLGADRSAAGYGMALLSVPLVWDAVKLSDTALCTLFDGIRDRDPVYRGNMAFRSHDCC